MTVEKYDPYMHDEMSKFYSEVVRKSVLFLYGLTYQSILE